MSTFLGIVGGVFAVAVIVGLVLIAVAVVVISNDPNFFR